jgi:hypothetical protein
MFGETFDFLLACWSLVALATYGIHRYNRSRNRFLHFVGQFGTTVIDTQKISRMATMDSKVIIVVEGEKETLQCSDPRSAMAQFQQILTQWKY